MNRSFVGTLLVSLAWLNGANVRGDESPSHPIAHEYGFLPPEIYKLDFRTSNLLIRDVRGNGTAALVVVNNANNRIDFLEPRDGAPPEPQADLEVNELPDDSRLRLRKIPIPRTVGSLEVRDVNGDNLPDLVYLGDPAGLYIEWQREDGSFQRGRTFNIDDAQTTAWSLDVADLNGDGRNDVAFLGKQNLYILYQDDSGRLKEPVEFRLSGGKASLIRLIDFDDDGRNDVVYLSDDQEFPVRVRFQDKEGGLGPERRFAIDPPRGVTYAEVDGKPGQELLLISNLSGRLLIYTLDRNSDSDEAQYQLVTYPFEKTGSAPQTDLAIADFDGDGFDDVVMGDSESARLVLYKHNGGTNLGLGKSFPGMLGCSQLRAADLDGDGRAELLSLSPSEKSIAVSHYDGSRLTFPDLLPTSDEPVAMEVLVPEEKEGNVHLVYLSRIANSDSRQERFVLKGLERPRKADAKWKSIDDLELSLKLQSKPQSMRLVDANLDGHPDLMLFYLFQPPTLLISDGKGKFQEPAGYVQGSLGTVNSPAAVFFGSLGSDQALLIAHSNFARNMQLDANSRWKIKDQYNASEVSANVTGVVALDVDGDNEQEIAMYDRNSSSVVILKMRDGIYRRWRTVKVGAFDLRGMRVADLDKDDRDDLLLFDTDKMSIIYNGKRDAVLKQIASYETDLRNGRLFDVAAGDLNGDKRLDLLLLEPVAHNLEIIRVTENNDLQRALRWQIFEEKTFNRSIGRGGMEPREMVVGDVNGDGLNDICILVHNRVLVYLQDTGVPPAGTQTTSK